MIKTNFSWIAVVIAVLTVTVLVSCNNHVDDIPFPLADSAYPQPVSQPLVFSAAKSFRWDTVKTGGIHPEIKKLDIKTLPSTPYDTSSFKPFASNPEEAHFDFNTLPDTTINLDKIPSKPLEFKRSFLAPPVSEKATSFTRKNGTTMSINEVAKAQGLYTFTIFCLLKDSKGFIWIGCDKGLYRFDGEYMQHYYFSPHGVIGLMQDNNGRIWFINTAGIGVIDPSTGTIQLSNKIRTVFPEIPTLIKDDKGNIWASQIEGKGVYVINPESQTYIHLDNKLTKLSVDDAWGLFQDNSKNIWLTTNGGADIINTETGSIKYLKKANGLSSDSLMAITGDKNGLIWMAFKNGGLDAVNIEQGSIKRYGNAQGFNNMVTYSLLCDNKGQVWMGTDKALVVADPEKKMINYINEGEGLGGDYILDLMQDDKQRIWVAGFQTGLNIIDQYGELVYPIGTKTISCLLEDAEGNIWVGTTAEGIAILDGKKHVTRRLSTQEGLSNNLIQGMIEVNGKIWITTNGGLDIIDPVHNTLEHIGKKEGLKSETIYLVIKGTKGNFFLNGPSEGVDMIDSAEQILLRAGINEGLSDSNIVYTLQDKQGKIWAATYSKGVDIIDPEKMTIQNLNNIPGLKDSSLKLILQDENGRMWISSDKGIDIADTKKGTLTSITTKEGLCNNNVTSLIGYKGSIVVGTFNKVSIITPPSYTNASDTLWKVALLHHSEGLVNGSGDWNSNIITKKGQYLWGDNGVTIINNIKDEHDSEITHVTGLTIMSQAKYFANKIQLNDKDTLWSTDTFFVKGQKMINPGYAIEQGGFSWDSVSGSYNLPVNLIIPYDQNYMQFQFGQENLGRMDTTSYSYILEGIDKHWSTPKSNSFSENYLNLSPGNYIFKVCSKNISGLWGKSATFSFTIAPPWWQSWWAYIVYILLLGGIIRGFIEYRSKQLLRENKLLEEKVEHRTNQLKKSIDDLKATQSQLIQSEKMASLGELAAGIAHEIQNPLNFVNNFSEVNTELIDELKEELNKTTLSADQKLPIEEIANDIKQNQEKINFHGKRADSIVKGMLQHSRSSSGVKELTDINVLADEYLRLAYHGLRAKDKTFNATMKTDFDESIGKINIVPQDIGRVILNLITNAFYSVTEKKKQQTEGAQYEPTVTVSTKKSFNKVQIIVKDNGNGIPQKVLDKIYQPFFTTKPTGQGTGLGLSMSYEIITKGHGGELKVETTEGEGAEFIITLPV